MLFFNRDIKYDKSKFTITGLIFLIIYALTSFILALRFAPKQMFLSRLEAFRGNGDGHLTEAKNTYIYLIFIAMCVFIVIAFLGSDYVPIFSGGVIAVISVHVFFKASRIAHNEAVYSASKALGYYCYAVALRYVLALWLISMVMLIIGQIRENLKRQHKI